MRASPLTTAVVAWLVPGGGHLLAGATQKAIILFIVLCGMFGFGLAMSGELFAFDTSDPLVFLAAVAQWAAGVPRLAAAVMGGGRGNVVAVTYEYGNTFLIVAGLLNMLVALDAFDRARGAKRP
jgi:hypothetical protein